MGSKAAPGSSDPRDPGARLFELDWIRVIAFGLLVPVHVGLGFLPTNPYGFSNDTHAGHGLVLVLLWVHQWRLALLFLVSGLVTAILLGRRSGLAFLAERAKRLVVPLVAATVLLLPLHTFLILKETGRLRRGEQAFLPYLANWWQETASLAAAAFRSPGPLWDHLQHLWFLLNLFLYSVILAAALVVFARPANAIAMRVRILSRIGGGAGIFFLAIPLVLVELALKPRWAGGLGTGYEFAWYAVVFAYGVALWGLGHPFWNAVRQLRARATVAGIVSFGCLVALLPAAERVATGYGTRLLEGGWVHDGRPWLDAYSVTASVLHAFNAWVWLVAIIGWSAHFLHRGSPTLTYLNASVYPAYISHMTFVLIGLLFVRRWTFWWPLELLGVCVFSLSASLAFYEVMRRFPPGAWLFAARSPRRRHAETSSNPGPDAPG